MATCRGTRLQAWLHSNKGITGHHLANVLSSAAFPDDLFCPSTTIQDLKVQAKKLTLYSDWAALMNSGSNTIATDIICSHPEKDQNGAKAAEGPINATDTRPGLTPCMQETGQAFKYCKELQDRKTKHQQEVYRYLREGIRLAGTLRHASLCGVRCQKEKRSDKPDVVKENKVS
eukprot:1161125-Pelagomonas_calceolata.AAC.11